METLGKAMVCFCVVTCMMFCVLGVVSDYQYNKQIASYWHIADKCSTLSKKSEYLDKFVDALDSGNFKGRHNSVFFKTPDNSFDNNFIAVLSLKTRLHEISKMSPISFEYQTAIQQITAQEQGEAKEMLHVFKGVWYSVNYTLLWDVYLWLMILLEILILGLGLKLININWDPIDILIL